MSHRMIACRLSPRAGVLAWSRGGRCCLSSLAAARYWSEHDISSYASPESDFTGQQARTITVAAATATTTRTTIQPSSVWSETLSFASPEADFSTALENAKRPHDTALPLTWKDALRITNQAALVITTATAPHKVVHVNAAWESLCGYTKDEALFHSIGPLLQNDQHKSHTNQAARHLIQQLQEDQYAVEHDAYLENFTKTGRPFLNHLRVGPLYLEDTEAAKHSKPAFLVAILEEVQREEVPLRLVV